MWKNRKFGFALRLPSPLAERGRAEEKYFSKELLLMWKNRKLGFALQHRPSPFGER